MSQARLANHNNFLYCTDLEPDDIISIMVLAQHITQQAKQSSTPINIAFLVGEGDSRIKLARMQKIVAQYQSIGLMKEVNISFIQGYSDFTGAQKEFAAEGKDVLTDEELSAAKSSFPDGSAEPTKLQARESIKQFLATHENTLVVSLKPMRELRDIAVEDSTVFNPHTLACTGSFNFRSICWDQKKEESESAMQAKLLAMLNAFKACFVYETHSTTEANSTSTENTKKFFEYIVQSEKGSILGSLGIFLANWKNYLLGEDRKRLPETLKKLGDCISAEQKELFISAISTDYTKTVGENLKAIAKQGCETHATNKDMLSVFQTLGRLVGKWESITKATMQVVNADPGLLAILCGKCDPANICAQAATMSFDGQYLKLIPREEKDAATGNMFVYLPGNLTLQKYLELRALQDPKRPKETKPEELAQAQSALLSDIHSAMISAAAYVFRFTIVHNFSAPLPGLAQSIQATGGSPVHSPRTEAGSGESVLTFPKSKI